MFILSLRSIASCGVVTHEHTPSFLKQVTFVLGLLDFSQGKIKSEMSNWKLSLKYITS